MYKFGGQAQGSNEQYANFEDEPEIETGRNIQSSEISDNVHPNQSSDAVQNGAQVWICGSYRL